MLKKISKEVEVKTSIIKAWEVYSTTKLLMIIQSELRHLFKVDILQGDGGVGSIFKVTHLTGASKGNSYKERYAKVDHEKKVKEMEIIEGWYLEQGLTSFRLRLEFLENQKEESFVLRVTAEYERNEDVIANVDASVFDIKPIMDGLEVVNQYIQNNKN